MKNWISTLIDTSDRSGYVEYGLIVAILATALFGAVTANGDDRTAVRPPPTTVAAEAVDRQDTLSTGLGLLFAPTSGGHRD